VWPDFIVFPERRLWGHTGDSVNINKKPMANPYILLREEFDDWAVLFDPDTGQGFGLNPTGVYLWKLLDGKHTLNDLLENIRGVAENVPETAIEHIAAFADSLAAEGLTGIDSSAVNLLSGADREPGCLEDISCALPGPASEVAQCKYETPRLVKLNSVGRAAYGACNPGSGAVGDCGAGAAASVGCAGGHSAVGCHGPCVSGDYAMAGGCFSGTHTGGVACG
jgi:SynChlorMet cassette protein ScmD